MDDLSRTHLNTPEPELCEVNMNHLIKISQNHNGVWCRSAQSDKQTNQQTETDRRKRRVSAQTIKSLRRRCGASSPHSGRSHRCSPESRRAAPSAPPH